MPAGEHMELFIFWFFCAVISGIIGSSKGRTGFGWFILGCFFVLFAVILVAVLPPIKDVDKSAPSPDTHVKCPDCRELVLKDARVCKHCRCTLVPQ